MLEFGVLGPLEVTSDGHPVDLAGDRLRRILVALLIDRNRPVTTDRLVEAVFDDAPTSRAEATLRTYLTRLRRKLGADLALEHTDHGYRLQVPDQALDAAHFESLVTRGRRALDYGDVAGAADTLATAVQLWRGTAYQGWEDRWWVRDEARRLGDLRVAAVEHLADAQLLCGRGSDAVPMLRHLLTDDPFHEGLTARLMLALAGDGRTADALTLYREHHALLAEELGIEPGPEVRDLQARILSRDPDLLRPARAEKSLRGYRLGERLGSGSHGTVFAAHLPGIDREYAVRIYRPDVADRPSMVRTFERDAHAAAGVDNPAVVTIHDAWREPGLAALVMRRMTGGTLQDRLDAGLLSPGEAAAVAERVGGALLDYANRGLVHGDVRPGNVHLDHAGTPFLGDPALGATVDGPVDDAGAFIRLVRSCFAVAAPEDLDRLGSPADGESTGAPLEATVRATLNRLRATARTGGNPYLGLRRFDEEDADRFFGRERLLDRMESLVGRTDPRVLAVVGGSGSGKSSVVRAGLLPRLRGSTDPSWLVTVMVPGASPLTSLSEALRRLATAAVSDTAITIDEPGHLARVARDLCPPESRLLLVVDQVEELFSVAEPSAADTLLAALAAAITDPDGPVTVVTTVRADYFDRLLSHPGLGPLLRDATLPVAAMTPSELEAAVRGPAAGRLTIEPGLTSEIVAAVTGRPAALPALQFTLHELAARDGSTVSLAALRDLGGVEGAIGSRADSLFGALTRADQNLLGELMSRLVVVGAGGPAGARITRSDLRLGFPGREADVDRIVEDWVAARLLTADRQPDTREPTVELAHEALIEQWPRLRAWVEASAARHRELTELNRAAAQWRELDRDRGALLRGTRLARALETTGSRDAPPDVAEYLDASRSQQDAEDRARAEAARHREHTTRRLRRDRWLLAAALVVVLLISAVAVERGISARSNAQASEARAQAAVAGLIASAGEVADTDWPLALLLAAEAFQLDDSPLSRRGLLTTLTSPRPVGTPIHVEPNGLQALAVEAGTGRAALVAPDGGLTVVDLPSGDVLLGAADVPAFPVGGGLDMSGDLVAAGGASTDGVGVVVHRVGADAPVATLETPVGQESKVAFSPDATTLAVTSHGLVRLVDTASWEVRARLGTGGAEPLIAVGWSTDGGRVYAGTEARVIAWEVPDAGSSAAGGNRIVAPDSDVALPASDEPAVFDIEPLPGGDRLAITTFDGAAYLLADHPLRIVEGPLQHDNVTVSLAASADGRRIAVAALNEVTVWQVAETPHGRPVRGTPVLTEAIDLAFLPDGTLLTVGSGGQLASWDLDPPSPVVRPLDALGAGFPTFSPSGDLLAMAGWQQGVRLFDGSTLEHRVTLDLPDPVGTSVSGLAFHPDEEVVYVLACRPPEPSAREYCPGTLSGYATGTGAQIFGPVVGGPVAPWVPTLLAMSSDGARLASGRAGGRVDLHDPDTLEVVAVLEDIELAPDARTIIQVDFAPDASGLVASAGDFTGLWDLRGEGPQLSLARWTGISAAFAPSGELVTSSQSGRLHLRDPGTLDVVREEGGLPLPLMYPQFSADGSVMVTSDDATGAVRVWTLPDLQSFGGPVPGAYADIHPDGSLVVIGGSTPAGLTLDPSDWVEAACATAGRNLSAQEWQRFFGSVPYRATCSR